MVEFVSAHKLIIASKVKLHCNPRNIKRSRSTTNRQRARQLGSSSTLCKISRSTELSKFQGIKNSVEQIAAQLQSANPIFAKDGWTALHKAASRGLGKVVARLLAACPSLIAQFTRPDEYSGEDTATALHCAARNGHAEIVAQLLAVDPALADARTSFGWAALHCAAEWGSEEVVAQ